VNSYVALQARNAWSNLLSLAGSHVVLAILSITSIAATVRGLGSDGYGRASLALSLAALLLSFGFNWSDAAVTRFGSVNLAENRPTGPVFWSRLALAGGWSILGFLILGSLWPLVWPFAGVAPNSLLVVLALALTFGLYAHLAAVLQALARLRTLSWARLLERSSYLLGLGGMLALGHGLTVDSVLWMTVAARAAAVLVSATQIPLRVWRPLRVERSMLAAMLKYSLPTIIAFASGYTFDWVDIYVLRWRLGFADVGMYQAGYQAMSFAAALLVPLTTIAFPALVGLRSAGRTDLSRQFAQRLVPFIVLGWSWLMAAAIVVSPWLVPQVLGVKPGSTDMVVRFLLVGTAFQCVTSLYTAITASYDQLPRVAVANVVMTAANIVLDLVLVRYLGLVGPAIGTALSYALGAWLYYRIGQRVLGRTNALVFLAVSPALVAVWLSLLLPAWWMAAPVLVAVAALACGLVRWFGALTLDDLDLMGRLGLPTQIRAILSRTFVTTPAFGPNALGPYPFDA